MINITSPSRHEHNIPILLDSPLYRSPSITTNSVNSVNSINSINSLNSFNNNIKRPLIINQKRGSVGSIYSNISSHHNYNNNNIHYKMNHHDLSFSTINGSNKENIPLHHSISNNSLHKSLTFNGSPTISRKSSIKKHLRKKSSNSMFKSNQSIFSSHNNHSRSKSQSQINLNNTNNHSQNNHNGNNNSSHSHNISINLKSLKHAKSNSSISSNSIFNCLSTKPSIDSIFNFSSNHNHQHNNNNSNTNKELGSPYPTNNIISIKNTPSQKSTDNSFYLSDDEINNTIVLNNSFEIIGSDNGDDNNREDDDDIMDFGSPLQKKVSSKKNIINSKIKHFNLQRHQSLMQFSSTSKDSVKNLNYKIDTEQLTSNINGLTVNSSDDDEFIFGNSVLNKSNIKFINSNDEGKIPRINVDQFKLILEEYKNKDKLSSNGKFCKFFDELLILDCRFKFEFDGGHIENALNISSFTELENTFFNDEILSKTPLEFNRISKKLLIFHCEFSSHRGPMKADQLRYFDRSLCGDFYPNLYYPDIIVLEGGYKDYYESEKSLHKSLSYIEMDHPLFKDERERNLDLLRKENNLSRQNSRNSSLITLSRKNSHSSIKSIQSISTTNNGNNNMNNTNTTNILDFSLGNKIETIKKRPSKRFLLLEDANTYDSKFDNRSISSTPLIKQDCGLFGGFGNQNIDLDNLIEINGNKSYDYEGNQNNNSISSNDDNDNEIDIDIDDTIDKVNLSSINNEGFKIPLPRPKFNRRNSLHLRSKTVSSFTFSNHSGFKSVPLLSTPEKSEAKFNNSLFDCSYYNVNENSENK